MSFVRRASKQDTIFDSQGLEVSSITMFNRTFSDPLLETILSADLMVLAGTGFGRLPVCIDTVSSLLLTLTVYPRGPNISETKPSS